MNRFIQLLIFLHLVLVATGQQVLLFEDFETGNFAAKGWYDGFPDQRTTAEFKNGIHSYEGRFKKGATTSGAGRHLFTPSDKVYLSYWVKYSSNYVGSGVGYHPHEWNILTNEDDIYRGPADTYLTAYIEQNAGRPILALQDSRNVDPACILLNNNTFVGCNGNFSTYTFNENRSVCSCNGIKGFLDRKDCFSSPGSSHGYYSSRSWVADSVYFRNTTGLYYKNNWHFVEAYFELNSIRNGKGIPDGKIRYWYDRRLIISSDSILFRTAAHPNMKFIQLFYGPYIGVGSPVEQTWWIDDVTVADGILTSGIQKNLPSSDIKVYPDPSDGNFTLTGTGRMEYAEIFNLCGEKLLSIKLQEQSSVRINLPEGLKGIFLVRTRNQTESLCSRIVVR